MEPRQRRAFATTPSARDIHEAVRAMERVLESGGVQPLVRQALEKAIRELRGYMV